MRDPGIESVRCLRQALPPGEGSRDTHAPCCSEAAGGSIT